LGERLHGMQEVRGSSPLSSTRKSLKSKDLRRARVVTIWALFICDDRCDESGRRLPSLEEPALDHQIVGPVDQRAGRGPYELDVE
jgi:hypothetical protein